MKGAMSFKYISEKDRPLNIPYPYKYLVDAFAAHPVLCLIMWCFIVGCMLGLCISPYEVLT